MSMITNMCKPPNFNCLERFVSLLALCQLCKNSLVTRIYAVVLLMVIITSFCYQIYGRVDTNFSVAIRLKTRGIVIGTLNTATGLLCNIVITLPALYAEDKLKSEIKDEMRDIDQILSKHVPGLRKKQHKSSTTTHLIILNIFYMGLLVHGVAHLWHTKGKTNYQFYGFDQLYRYRITTCTVYIYYLIKGCLYRIMAANNIVKVTLKEARIQSLMDNPNLLKDLEELIADMSYVHSKFPSMVGSLNSIFGWSVLLIFFNYILLFMTTYEMGLSIAANRSQRVDWYYVYWTVFSMAYSVMALILLTSICHRLTVEANKIGDLCYFHMYNLDLSEYKEEQGILVKLLVTLIRQSKNKASTTFSAAGFFPINYSTLFMLVNLLTSYLLALIQF